MLLHVHVCRACVQAHIKRKLEGIGPTQTAFLVGEGWGALVAIAAAAQCT